MAVPTVAEFLQRFPEYGELPVTVLEGVLGEAGRYTPETVWRTVHTEGVSYMAAHLLSLRTQQLGADVGSPSGNPTGELIQSTRHGQEYQRLRDSLPLCGFAV